MTKWRMCNACWLPEAKNTHSEYVILIAFPPQQLLHKRASMLRYRYIACLVKYCLFHVFYIVHVLCYLCFCIVLCLLCVIWLLTQDVNKQ